MEKERNLSIELLKFIAVIIVINSHFDPLYGEEYHYMSTGGAIGDALFFFASGFTLFLGRLGRFDNWYKRRVRRIYPSILAFVFVCSLLFDEKYSAIQVIAGYWFVSCIMLYYVALYFVRKYAPDKPLLPFIIVAISVLVWYYFEDSSKLFMYGATFFKWLHYFLFMLLGAYVGNNTMKYEVKPLRDAIMLATCTITYYGILFAVTKNEFVAHFQVLSLFPLLGVVTYVYKLCCASKVEDFLRTKVGLCIRFVSGLCLESYIVQGAIIKFVNEQDNVVLPYNLIVAFIMIIAIAYLTRCLARIISQIFEKEDFNWNAIFSAVS